MSELDEIMAAAGIVVVDTPATGDGGDADNKYLANHVVESGRSQDDAGVPGGSGDCSVTSSIVSALEAMFAHRYTLDDPDYAQAVQDDESHSRPPCVTDFREKRNWGGRGRGGRGRGGYHNRHDNYNYNRQDNRYRDREDHRHDNRYRDREDHRQDNRYRDRSDYHRDGGDYNRRNYDQYQDRHRDRDQYH